jgi:uncharacterized membrane protein YtjA (UPF0391 family)
MQLKGSWKDWLRKLRARPAAPRAALFGFTDLAAASADVARILFYIFLVIFLVLLVQSSNVGGSYQLSQKQ